MPKERQTKSKLITIAIKAMKNEKGSITIEAAIIYPIIFLVLMTLIYFMMGLYRQVSALAVADLSVEEAKVLAKEGDKLYGGLSRKNIKNQLKTKGEKDAPLLLIGGYLDDANVTVERNLFFQKIRVTVSKSYPTGVDFIDSMLGEPGKGFTVDVESGSKIMDQAEFIRNVDMMSDFAGRIPAVAKFKQSYNKKLDEISNKIKDYFKTDEN